MIHKALEILKNSEIVVDFPKLINQTGYFPPQSLWVGEFDFSGNKNYIISPGYGYQNNPTALYFKYVKDPKKENQVESMETTLNGISVVKIKKKNLILRLVPTQRILHENFSNKEGEFKGQLKDFYNIKDVNIDEENSL